MMVWVLNRKETLNEGKIILDTALYSELPDNAMVVFDKPELDKLLEEEYNRGKDARERLSSLRDWRYP